MGYCIILLLAGTGWYLLLYAQKGVVQQRTLQSRIASDIRRIWNHLPRREWLQKKAEEKRNALRQPALELEIYKSSILLKNIAFAERERPFSADYIIERLMEHSQVLKPVYGEVLTRYRNGKMEEAFYPIMGFCNTRSAKNFCLVLSKLDQISPDELVEQIVVFQEMMEQQRMTAEMKMVQRNSVVVTALASAAMFTMMLDFTVVIVFMKTITMIEGIF